MKKRHIAFLLLFFSKLSVAQAGLPVPNALSPSASDTSELKALREALNQTREQVNEQQREIEALKQRLTPGRSAGLTKEDEPSRPVETHSETISQVQGPSATSATSIITNDSRAHNTISSFKIGDATFTLGGFVDIENIFRTTNTQSNIATDFGLIPFSNTPQGHLTEFRTTAQYSRLNLKVENKFGANELTGYVETDFSGNSAPGVYQSVNPHTNRLRLFFGDFKRGEWEFLGGQTWSWLTPNRSEVSPMPIDLALTYNEDQNLGVGVPYTRAAELRVAYHPNDHWALGVGIEDPNQYIGGYVALPAAFSTTLSPQFDNGNQTGAANLFPDILSKIAYDTQVAGRHFHLEAVGLVTSARERAPQRATSFSGHSVVGGGGSIATNFDILKNLTFLGNAFWSDGGAHYLVATGPQVVLRPNATGTDVTPSMVHAGAGSAGFEWRATAKSAFAAYYGADYYQRNFFVDTTNSTNPTAIIGFGGPGSPNTNNRAIQQITFDWLQTLWKHEKYGALQFYTQYSYLTRDPWSVSPGDPKNAHLSMVYAGFRYVLPGTSGTLLRVPYPN